MKIKLLFVLILYCSISEAIARQEPARLLIDSLYDLGNQLTFRGDLDGSLTFYEQARSLAFEHQSWKQYFNCEEQIVQVLWQQYKTQESIRRSELAIQLAREKMGEKSLQEANFYAQIGVACMLESKLDSSILNFNRSILLLEPYADKGHETKVFVLGNLGASHYWSGDLNEALSTMIRANELTKLEKRTDTVTKAEGLANIGVMYLEKGMYQLTLDYYLRAYDLMKAINYTGENYTKLLSNIGALYLKYDEFDKSFRYRLPVVQFRLYVHGDGRSERCKKDPLRID
ncbi:MAG: tetratricopeptide repeat protein [Bacteroidota bacterium]